MHRALIRAGKLGPDGLPDDTDLRTLAEIAANISATERRAMKAERETADRLIAHFLADRVGATFEGHISGVTRAGLFVELDETGADGFIPARSSATNISASTKPAAPSSAARRRTGSAIRSPSNWSRRRPSPAPCVSSLCGHARARAGKRLDIRRASGRNRCGATKSQPAPPLTTIRFEKDRIHGGRRYFKRDGRRHGGRSRRTADAAPSATRPFRMSSRAIPRR